MITHYSTCVGIVLLFRREVTALHRDASKAANSGGGAGKTVMEVLNLAKAAVDAVAGGTAADDEQYQALNQTLASALPDWRNAQNGVSNKKPALGFTLMQDTAGQMIEQHLEDIRPYIDLYEQRRRLRDRLHIVLRAWREEVEHSGPARLSALRWRVRRPMCAGVCDGGCASVCGDVDRRASSIMRTAIDIPSSVVPRVNKLLPADAAAIGKGDAGEKQGAEPRSDWTLTQRLEAIKTCMRVSATRPNLGSKKREKAARHWSILRKGYARVAGIIKGQQREDDTDNAQRGAGERASRSAASSSRLDYREGALRRRNHSGAMVASKVRSTITRPRRRERTTRVAKIGMELYGWMREIGDQANRALGWRRGIG